MYLRAALATAVALILTAMARSAPEPGDVFSETTVIRFNTGTPWGFFVEGAGVNFTGHADPDTQLAIDGALDLSGAIKVEAQAQKALVDGNSGLKIQINGNAWINFPDPPGIANWNAYQHQHYPTVTVPTGQLRQGTGNWFKLRAINPSSRSLMVYGITFRIYYDPSAKPHPTGRINSISNGQALGESVVLTAEASSPNGGVKQVDYVGYYEDVNYLGDGNYRQWQYHMNRKTIFHHLGSNPARSYQKAAAPYRVTWNTGWVPDQPGPMKIAARITDETGLIYMTEPVTGLTFNRPGLTVELCKPYNIPTNWLTRSGTKGVNFDVKGNLADMVGVKMATSTWNGEDNRGFVLNGTPVTSSLHFAGSHNYGFSFNTIEPKTAVRSGRNRIEVRGGAEAHGMEMQYPGPMMLIQYKSDDYLPTRTSSRAFRTHRRAMRGAVRIFDIRGRSAGTTDRARGIYAVRNVPGSHRSFALELAAQD